MPGLQITARFPTTAKPTIQRFWASTCPEKKHFGNVPQVFCAEIRCFNIQLECVFVLACVSCVHFFGLFFFSDCLVDFIWVGGYLTCLHVWFVFACLMAMFLLYFSFLFCAFYLSLFAIFILLIVRQYICRCGRMGVGHEKAFLPLSKRRPTTTQHQWEQRARPTHKL